MRNGLTVLLVENDPIIRQLIVRALTRAGFTVIEAVDGADAFARVGADPGGVDILVTDVVMPRKDGFTLAEEFAALAPDVRVLFITGHAHDLRGVRSGLEQSHCRFLLKPFTTTQLVTTLREVLRSDPQPRRTEGARVLPIPSRSRTTGTEG